MKNKPLLLTIILLTSFIFIGNIIHISGANQGDVLISEVLYDTPGTDSVEEWVELYNPTSSSLDLSGWYLQDNAGSFALSGNIPSHSYLTIARDSAGFSALYGINPDISGMTLALGNSGDLVGLYDNSNNLIDRVAWENELAGWSISAVHTTLERTDLLADNVGSWQDSGTLGVPGENSFLGTTSSISYLVINEVFYDTPGTDSVEEWIELWNPTSSTVDLAGYSITDGEATFSLAGSVSPGSYFVVASDTAGFNALYGFNPDLSGMTLALANSGDSVTLSTGATTVDFVAWEGDSGWTLTASTGESLSRTAVDDTDTQADWTVTATVTPGAINDGSGGGNPPPDTTAPSISITNPADNDIVGGTITIVTSSSDNVGVTSVEIYIDGSLIASATTYVWDTTTVGDAVHSISATAYDAAGNSDSVSISVTVDNANYVPPSIGNVKIMSYNIEASGSNPDWMQVVQEENPDVAIFIETGTWDDNNNQLLNQYCSDFNVYFTGIGEDPYNCVGTTGIAYSTSGEAVFSRFPIVDTLQLPFVTLDDGTSYDVSHDFLDVSIDIGGTVTHVVAAHLKCCGGVDNEAKREFQQEGIINHMDSLGDVPIIYAGDLNSFSPEDTGNLGDLNYGPMSMMLKDDTYGSYSARGSVSNTWDDPLTTLYPGQFFPTYGHQNPIYTSRIDFINLNQHFLASNYISATVGDTATADTGSDHYSTDVTYDFGDGSGGDTTPPSQVTGLVATSVSSSQIDLSWNAATDDVGVDHYNIYRDAVFLTSTTGTTYSDSGLQSSTSYTYEVSAVDAAGNEGSLSSSASATTDAAADTTPPSQVTGLIATSVSSSQIDLNWNAATDDVGVDHYNIYRDAVYLTSTAGITYSDTGLQSSTSYTYEVSAIDAAGNEGISSSPASATTDSVADTTPPSQVTGLVATSVSSSQIDLSWNAATDDVGVDHYNIYRDGVFLTTSLSTSFSDTGLQASTTYTYTISAVDGAGNEGVQSTSAQATTGASQPQSTMHVASITVSNPSNKGPWKNIEVIVTVHDSNGNPLASVAVTITLTTPGGNSYTLTQNTESNGQVVFTIEKADRVSGTYSATVDDLTLSSYVYDPSANIETTDSVVV